MADPLRHNFPCLSIAGLVTFGRCLNCNSRSCYIQAWKEHLHVGLLGDAEHCPQCEALRDALEYVENAYRAAYFSDPDTTPDIRTPTPPRPIEDVPSPGGV